MSTVSLLLEAGADANCKDDDESTPLIMCAFFACKNNRDVREMIKLLLHYKADPNWKTKGVLKTHFKNMSCVEILKSSQSELCKQCLELIKWELWV